MVECNYTKENKIATKIPKSMPFRVCVYPCTDERGVFVAHCLELDVIGDGTSVEAAISELLKVIETQIEICGRTGAQLLFPAPGRVWQKYMAAKKINRKVPGELVRRIVASANKRLGHPVPRLDDILASKDVPEEYLAVA